MYNEYPPAVTLGPDGKPAHSWRVLLLPFFEQKQLYERYSFDEPWNGPNNKKLGGQMPALFSFAGSHIAGESCSTNFVAITGSETVWPPSKAMTYEDVEDPPSRTIRFAEYNGPPIHWMSPVDLEFATMSFKVGDPAGIDSQYLDPAVAMVNGSVQKLSSSEISKDGLRALCMANGNDASPADEHFQEMDDARMRELKASWEKNDVAKPE